MCCFRGSNELETGWRGIHQVLIFRLWDNLSFENLNLEHRLERNDTAVW